MKKRLYQWFFPPSKEGAILGYCGLVPFVFLSVVSLLAQGDLQQDILFGLLAYAASILSFLGAIHWGLALRESTPPAPLLVWAVVPSLTSWCALMAGANTGLWIIAAFLWFSLLVDWKIYPRYHLNQWLGMRLTLTFIASMSCFMALLATQT